MKSFKERFNIPDSRAEAEDRFINRIETFLEKFFTSYDNIQSRVIGRKFYAGSLQATSEEIIVHKLGLKKGRNIFDGFMLESFVNCLRTLEALNGYFFDKIPQVHYAEFNKFISALVAHETLLEINWENGFFLPRGANELDKKLVSEVLDWLSRKDYANVKDAYSRSLVNLSSGRSTPMDLISSIRDAYESLEILSKVLTGKLNNDLSSNRELFIRNLKLGPAFAEYFKETLRDYITLANKYRHGHASNVDYPKYEEAESLVYLTGTIMRIAIQSTQK